MPTKLSISKIVLHVVALKMAAWSKAILRWVEASERIEAPAAVAGSVGERVEMSSIQPAGPEEVGTAPSGAKPVSGGPPAHWIERVRRGAPQLLGPVGQTVHRTPPAVSETEKAAAPLLKPKDQPQNPSYPSGSSAGKESIPREWPVLQFGQTVNRTRPAVSETEKAAALLLKPKDQPQNPSYPSGSSAEKELTPRKWAVLQRAKQAGTEISYFTSERSRQQTEPAYPATGRQRSPRIQAPAIRIRPEQKHSCSLESQVCDDRRGGRALYCGETVEAAADAALNFPREPTEDLWPQLPESALPGPEEEQLTLIRERERLRRLDGEQRGIYGARRIST
jgi:hypothetical protein